MTGTTSGPDGRASVMFVCVHNAGRSQMAAAYLRQLSGGAVEVRSAGSVPASEVSPVAVAAMAEEGIDLAAEKPKILTAEAVQASDVVVTMGCGDACPFFPGKRYEDWQLEDPAGQGIETVRVIRDDIRRRVVRLLAELSGPAGTEGRTKPAVAPAEVASHPPAGRGEAPALGSGAQVERSDPTSELSQQG